MPEVSLQRPRVVPFIGQRKPTCVSQHMSVSLEAQLAPCPGSLDHSGEPGVLNGAPRSDVNTKGLLGSCSRCSRRRARNSSPSNGCVLGVPCLSRRTCNVAVLNSI